ncbi:20013_t:CDS:2, partial [Racocetra persica]
TKLSHQVGELLRELQQEYLISVSDNIASVIKSQEFFNDVECLARILYPAKEAIKAVEYKSTTLQMIFFHPKYHGAGLQIGRFQIIAKAALNIWKSLGGGDKSAGILLNQMKNYHEFIKPYDDH